MTVRLFILGALRRGPRHGYLVRQEAVVDQTESWADIKAGSVYHALHRLVGQGLVQEVGVEQDAGPARTVFALTDTGSAEMRVELERLLGAATTTADPFDVALRLADELDRAVVLAALEGRRASLRVRAAELHAVLAGVAHHLTPWETLAFGHVVSRVVFEAEWTEGLITQVGATPEPGVPA